MYEIWSLGHKPYESMENSEVEFGIIDGGGFIKGFHYY